jgi:V8-like Glu-specific endopeptidase
MAHAIAPHGGGALVRGAPWVHGGLVVRTTGRVFFMLDGVDYACSGSTVGGANKNVVITAAHCVSDGAGGWAVGWTFVPGYDGGREPYGRYAAQTFFVSGRWVNGGNEDDDVAFVDMRPGPAKAGGVPRARARAVGDVVGRQPISFGARGGSAAVFGYPAEAPYTGGRLDYCQGPVTPDPYGAADVGLPCAMTEGDSGGPWLSGSDPAAGTGTITGVSSFKYSGQTRILYSANLGPVAQALYTRAEHP